MRETEWIADQVERACDGNAWHGPATRQVLEGVTAEQAAARPVSGAHTIWEIVHHLTAWAHEVERRLFRFAQPLDTSADWPPVPDGTAESWIESQDALRSAHARLRAAIREFPPHRLDEGVPGATNGRGASYYAMLHGLAQHDAYHTGQIAMLKKAMARTPPAVHAGANATTRS